MHVAHARVLAACGAFFAIPKVASAQATGADGASLPESEAGDLTGTPYPNAMTGTGNDWRFSWHGYLRAPMRIGMSARPGCSGNPPGTALDRSGVAVNTTATTAFAPPATPCAGPGQPTTSFHSPMIPDDQYLAWTYDRQSEKDLAEVFLSYGNDIVVGTVGLEGLGFTDAGYNHNYALQLGIAQGYVTITPDLNMTGLKTEAKVGSFWSKYGMAGEADAGKYDTYLFGRTHQMGETLKVEYSRGPFRFRLEDGIGTKSEQVAVGNAIVNTNMTPYAAPTVATSSETSQEGMPGFTLLHHLHAGFSYQGIVEVNAHYLEASSQDARIASSTVTGSNGGNGGIDGGQISVVGGEARLRGGMFGNLYIGYSNIDAKQAEYVGPVIEVIHSMGGGGNPNGIPFFDSGNGLVDNYLGACGPVGAHTCPDFVHDQGTGTIQTVLMQYDYSFGLLYRKLRDPGSQFRRGDGSDLTLSMFFMYNAITTRDGSMPTQRLKYGADLVYSPLPWFGVGARVDEVNPNLTNDGAQASQETQFTVIGPKLTFRTRFLTHEEITAQWLHYTYAKNVLPQAPYNGLPYQGLQAGQQPVAYYPDPDVFGLKATMWW
jgi:hypothetical protein